MKGKLSTGSWVAAAGLVVVVLGCLGPWAKVLNGFLSVDGVDTDDGKLALGAAALVLLVLVAQALQWSKRSLTALLIPLGLVIAGIAIWDLGAFLGKQDGGAFFGNKDVAAPGWGLWFVLIGGATIACSALIDVVAPTPPPGGPPRARIAIVAGVVAVAVVALVITTAVRDETDVDSTKADTAFEEADTPAAPTTPTVAAPPPTPPKPKTKETQVAVGDTANDDGVAFRVRSIEYVDEIATTEFLSDTPVRPAKGARLASVVVEWRNDGKRAVDPFCGATGAILVDTQGREFRPEEQALVEIKGNDKVCTNDVQPGFSARTTIPFQIPKGTTLAKLYVWNPSNADYEGARSRILVVTEPTK